MGRSSGRSIGSAPAGWPEVRSVLLVAAEAFELKGIVRRLTDVTKTGWPVRYSQTGILNGVRITVVAGGPGPGLASGASSRSLELCRPDAVFSVGLCGGLDPALGWRTVVTGRQVVAPGGEYATPAAATARGDSVRVVSQDRVANSREEKAVLRQWGEVVEMEALAVAREAARVKVPFGCVKVVSDTADETFVTDLNQARDAEGRFRASTLVMAAMRRPHAGFAELLMLRRRSAECSEALGEFFADYRF